MSRSRKTIFNERHRQSYRRITPEYPSSDSTGHNTSTQEPLQYTGDYVKGIATLHKSNLVPVTNDDQAKEISRMRR